MQGPVRGGGAQALDMLGVASIVVSCGALAAGYALAGWSIASGLPAAIGALWLVFRKRNSTRVGDIGLIAATGAAAVGVMLDAGAAWMLVGLVAALTAWDLEAFGRWLQDCPIADEARALQRTHLQRLLVADLLGLGLGLLALQLRMRLRLAVLVLLGAVLAIGLSRVVRYLRRQAE